jgi:hypothetical protein
MFAEQMQVKLLGKIIKCWCQHFVLFVFAFGTNGIVVFTCEFVLSGYELSHVEILSWELFWAFSLM